MLTIYTLDDWRYNFHLPLHNLFRRFNSSQSAYIICIASMTAGCRKQLFLKINHSIYIYTDISSKKEIKYIKYLQIYGETVINGE